MFNFFVQFISSNFLNFTLVISHCICIFFCFIKDFPFNIFQVFLFHFVFNIFQVFSFYFVCNVFPVFFFVIFPSICFFFSLPSINSFRQFLSTSPSYFLGYLKFAITRIDCVWNYEQRNYTENDLKFLKKKKMQRKKEIGNFQAILN